MTNAPDKPKVAVITGSSGGIGAAVARRFAASGHSLLLAYGKRQNEAEELAAYCRGKGACVEVVAGDLRGNSFGSELVATCVERFTKLDILVHCAGMAQESLLATLSDLDVESLISLHIRATIALTRAAIRPMMTARQGRVVLLSSVAAQKPGPGAAVYAGCKGFIESFARAMAVEVGRKGITVNCVAPGLIDTQMTRQIKSLVGPALNARSAVKRMGSADEVAAAVEFLCAESSSYINGHTLAVDGSYLGPP